MLGIFPKGWRVPLSYRRRGERYDILVRLTGVHSEAELLEQAVGRPPDAPMPLPKPKEEPREPREGEKPKDQPRRSPLPRVPGGRPPIRAAAPVPEIVKKHFEERQGFANYYFND